MTRFSSTGIIFETVKGTCSFGKSGMTIYFAAPHKRAPHCTAIPINSTNANYNASILAVTTAWVSVGLSSPAPHDLVIHVQAASYL